MLSVLMFVVVVVDLAEAIVYGRIVSSEVKNRNFAYAISIMKNSQVHCAGILIKLEWTLTACCCVGYFYGKKFYVYRTGTIVLIGGTIENVVTSDNYEHVQLRKAIHVVHHPNCSEGRGGQVWGHDFGLYKSDKFELKKELRPANIHPEDRLRDMILLWVSLEAVCETIGWGMTVINFTTQYFKPSNTLKVADVHLMDWGECGLKLCQQPLSICDEKIYGLGKLCAMNINGSDSCDKDEGGALVCGVDWLVGFSSKSLTCGEYFKPRLYSSILYGYGWITSVTSAASSKFLISSFHYIASALFIELIK